LPEGAVARIGTVRLRQSFVGCVAFSPNGRVLASGGRDDKIRFWDPATGKEVRSFAVNKQGLNAIAFSRDGALLASAGQDPEIIVWRMASGEELYKVKCRDPLTSIAISPDGKLVASGDQNNAVRVWDVNTGKEIQCSQGKEGYGVIAVAFSPDGKTLAAARGDGPIQLWNVASWKLMGSLDNRLESVWALAFSPDGKRLFTGAFDTALYYWDMADTQAVKRLESITENTTRPKLMGGRLAVAPDGKSLASARPDGSISLWDATTGKELRRWEGDTESAYSLTFSPDGKVLACASRNRIRLWDPQSGRRLDPFTEPTVRPRDILFSPNGKSLVVDDDAQTVRIVDLPSGKDRLSVELPIMSLWSLTMSSDGSLIAFAQVPFFEERRDSRIRLLDVATGKVKGFSIKQSGIVERLAFSPDGRKLAGWCGQEYLCWDLATGKELTRWQTPGRQTSAVAFSADGRILARTGQDDGLRPLVEEISLWNAASGKRLRSFGQSPDAFRNRTTLTLSPDGKTLASAVSDSPRGRGDNAHTEITLWEAATGRERCRLKQQWEGSVSSVAFSPDGSLIATADRADWVVRSESISLWDAVTGANLGRLAGHRCFVEALAFSPDGKVLVSGSADGTMLVWDLSSIIAKPKATTDKLTTDRLTDLWADLKHGDAARAYQAIGTLARHPSDSVPFVRKSLIPGPAPDPQVLRRLIADLDRDDFDVREKASTELARLGFSAGPALQRALEGKPSAEARRRLKELVRQLEERMSGREKIRLIRTVEALERMGTADARKLLQDLQAGGEWSAAEDAKLSLERLARRAGRDPRPR
jgi:WD40 repeat protein